MRSSITFVEIVDHCSLANAKLLRKPNVRRIVLDEAAFQRLLEASEEPLKAILLVAFDTGMRQREILDLRWEQLNLREGVIRLAPQDTKGEESRLVVLTHRVRTVLEALPRGLPTTPLFRNPRTGEAWQDIRKAFHKARKAAGLDGVWFHDLRRYADSRIMPNRRCRSVEVVCSEAA